MTDDKGKGSGSETKPAAPPPTKSDFPAKELFREGNDKTVQKPQRIIRGNE